MQYLKKLTTLSIGLMMSWTLSAQDLRASLLKLFTVLNTSKSIIMVQTSSFRKIKNNGLKTLDLTSIIGLMTVFCSKQACDTRS